MTEQEWRESSSWRGVYECYRGADERAPQRDEWTVRARRLRLWACACLRWKLDREEAELLPAIETVEQVADGFVPRDELSSIEEWALLISGEDVLEARRIAWQKGDLLHFACRVDGTLDRAVGGGGDTLVWDRNLPAAAFLRDIFGNPFRPVAFSSEWRTDTALTLARTMYESREFSAMPILADALQDAGCDSDDILNHCRDTAQVHVRGCWVVDLVLGKV